MVSSQTTDSQLAALLEELSAATSDENEPPSDRLPPSESDSSASLESESPSAAENRNAKVMIVDDEPVNVKIVTKYLKSDGFHDFVEACEPTRVVATLETEQPDILLLDIMMPEIDGLTILRHMKSSPDLSLIPTIILTADDDRRTKAKALDSGATDFLTKPVDAAELRARVRNVLAVKAYQNHLKTYARELERQVQERTAELAASRLEVIHCLGRAAEYRDNDTGRHVIRVGRYAETIARQLGLDERTVELIGHAAPLHDVGKIGIPDSILLKPGKLEPEEFEMMKKHCGFGKKIFEPMSSDEWSTLASHTSLGARMMFAGRSPVLKMASSIALTHHEKWDGSGYPLGLSGRDIPIEGRITAVADVFDALSTKRPYKPPFPLDKTLAILEDGRGSHFDPDVIDAFFACRKEILQIQLEYADVE